MFNFNELTVVQSDDPNCSRGSFVGIRKDKYLGRMAFTLPKGFADFEINYENVKKLFFSMYRTFEKFRQNGEKYLDSNQRGKDNVQVQNQQGAYIFIDEENNETILYSKIDLIDKIFQTYKELEIESLIQELGLVEDVDYSKIEHYLDKGIYLSNDAIFIDQMINYRNIVRGIPSELIELFCYIYSELAKELGQELTENIKEISYTFAYKYLSLEQSLFSEHSFESTIGILKDCLDNIHKTTAYKNDQYWDIYEAVEHFLYGSLIFDEDSQQGFWGINNFSYIWEEMCNHMVANQKEYEIIYCDSELPLNQYKPNLTKDYVWIDKGVLPNNPFCIDFNGFKRWIRPDILYRKLENNTDEVGGRKSINASFNDNFDIKIASKYGSTRKTSRKVAKNNLDPLVWTTITQKGQNNEMFWDLYHHFQDLINLSDESKKASIRLLSMGDKNSFYIQKIREGDFSAFLRLFKKRMYQKKFYRDNKSIHNGCFLVDWKYYSYENFTNSDYRNNERVNASIIKSLAYEFCLSQIVNEIIQNQFCVPCYDGSVEGIVVGVNQLDCNIDVIKMNFNKIQEIYLNG